MKVINFLNIVKTVMFYLTMKFSSKVCFIIASALMFNGGCVNVKLIHNYEEKIDVKSVL